MEEKYELRVNNKLFFISNRIIKGHEIKKLINADDSFQVCCSTSNRDYLIGGDQSCDITQPGRNNFFVYNPKSTEG